MKNKKLRALCLEANKQYATSKLKWDNSAKSSLPPNVTVARKIVKELETLYLFSQDDEYVRILKWVGIVGDVG